ncbi:MAG: hypothetical protein MI866_05390 [Bacteroidales bacterium]|nr:hypothetical protein [Bacteroidales bacterium]
MVLISLVFSSVVLGSINVKQKTNILLFFASTIMLIYVIFGLKLAGLAPGSISGLDYQYALGTINSLLGIWLIGIHKTVAPNVESKKLVNYLVVIMGSILFSVSTFSSIGPIAGALIIGSNASTSLAENLLPIILFAIGLIIPVSLLLLFIVKQIEKVRSRLWWNIVRVVFGSLLLIFSILGLVIR